MTYNPRSRPNHHPAANSAGCQRVVPPTPNTGKDATMRDCQAEGHILFADDPECLSCNEVVAKGELVAVHAHITEGASRKPDDIADPQEWGTAG